MPEQTYLLTKDGLVIPENRDKGTPESDAEKLKWWIEMAKHVSGHETPDPRCNRPDFKPWTYKGE